MARNEGPARPVQAFQYALVYELFGKRPLGYHILSSTSFFVRALHVLCRIAHFHPATG